MELELGAPRRSRSRHAVSTRRASACLALAALLGAAALAAPAAAAPSLETFVFAAGGVSSGPLGGCTTFMAPAPVAAFFGGGVSIPLDGLPGCNVAGGFDDATGAAGPIALSRPLSSSWSTESFSGTASAQSDYGHLVASGHSVFSGFTSSTTVTGAEGFGRCNDSFTITSPSVAGGQPGTIRVLVTIVGGLSTSANATADVELNYQVGGPSIYTMFRSQANNAIASPYVTSLGGVGLAGFALAPGSMSGSGQVGTFAHAIVFGTPITFNLGLFAYTVPGAASTVDSHFEAYVSGIQVTGPQGQVVTDFVATAASGTTYGPAGVTAVDGPAPGVGGDAVRFAVAPNPTAAGARLSFRLPQRVAARLAIYDAAGRRVRLLRDGEAGPAASESAWWDGRDDHGALLPSGAYYARLNWAGGSRTVRVVLAR